MKTAVQAAFFVIRETHVNIVLNLSLCLYAKRELLQTIFVYGSATLTVRDLLFVFFLCCVCRVFR